MPITPLLWICIGLFFVRVTGQVEALLLGPAWLPPMSAWYSGLLPYPVLLPLQIALLMLMCAIAARRSAGALSAPSPASAGLWRALAYIYFAIMAARLAWCVRNYGRDFYLHGGIPIAFHWVLALFICAWARGQQNRFSGHTDRSDDQADRSCGQIDRSDDQANRGGHAARSSIRV